MGDVVIDGRFEMAIACLMWPDVVTFKQQRDIDGLYVSVPGASHAVRGISALRNEGNDVTFREAHNVADVLKKGKARNGN